MSFIQPEDKTPLVDPKVKIRQDVDQLLIAYAEHIHSSKGYVLQAILLKAIGHDKKFMAGYKSAPSLLAVKVKGKNKKGKDAVENAA